MCMVFVMAMQFLSQLKTSDFLRTIEYQPEVPTPLRDTSALPALRVTANREIY